METASPSLAVALRYAEDDNAPVVVASGRGDLAERIIEAAQDAGVSIEENPLLASALEHAPIDEPIPEELYQAVAGVISWVLAADTRKAVTPNAPDDSAVWSG